VFLGWGEGEEAETGGAKKIEEKPETKGRRHKVPVMMYGPATVLVLLAISIGVLPGVRQAAQKGATRFADYAGYQARVLDNAKVPLNPPPVEHTFPISGIARSVAAAAAAFALAWFALSPYWPRKKSWASPVKRGLYYVRRIHSGHVGDYVAFLTFGLAAFAIALAGLIRHWR
jgi:multicomponent Na+:H+ antiporter subunit D